MFHMKYLDEFLQISMIAKFDDNNLRLQCYNQHRIKSQGKCRHLLHYNPMYQNLRQNF
jgi:hypothetical protein